MPTYSYACTECDNRFDIVQSFTDDTLTVCPACSGKLRKLFNSVGIVFKGSGFYRTDSRGGSSTSSEGAGEKKSDAAATKSDSKTDSKPAEKKSSDSSSSSSSSSSSTTKAAASQ
ncbi:FmdB family transcriptional regulator [Rhodococcus sp. IEGM 1401]|jgi:putative FmdB family regulatory protein|uniref:FmdB family zinc ribbon protein n=1 Tax=Rhodococcus cerastii TaxID=908616 RepID=A0ABU4CXF9_9NOCA|nr:MULTISPECIES: FmdB family zinc ribbon protein [Rhodococcus]KAA0927843.1 FmdB family transcriptional regulator [Rhodococcus sp. ANT_H53B]MCZ4560990.1 FmdB family transcriptional regulator [Rhodococcus sp. IEGM 1401]MDI6630398.1 zinc ribbon domain-containing protein [Rhodococcus sp. (in: high G+C Gram-positive bacteria)]MDI9921104.1 zinc ribbon domain-containing protein [Rhodococcus sp. IEGM 1372]MDI9925690.1 zinc ribbon domain-containing protein [Rhodococcus sp. IEGM 1341]